MKIIYMTILCFCSLKLAASDTVRIYNATSMVVTGTTNKDFALESDSPSGDATTADAPARVYVPIKNTGTTNLAYFAKARSEAVTSLFDTTSATDVMKFPLHLNLSGTTQYLYAAVYNGTNYTIMFSGLSPPSFSDSTDYNFEMSVKSICDRYPSSCTNLESGSTTLTKATVKVYFFISTDLLGSTDTFELATRPGGIFFEVVMSNRIYSISALTVSISKSIAGDGRVFFEYNANSTMTDFKKIIVYKFATAPISDNNPIIHVDYNGGSILNQTFSAVGQSGRITVTKLTNGVAAILSIGFQDKFGFVSTLSTHVEITPQSIEELLKNKKCYLLTAGFKEEHYVVDYFRKYRDQVLMNSFLGRKFIKFYYKTAPQYAMAIYKNQGVSLVIQGGAYLLYFFLNYFWVIFIILPSCYFFQKRIA